MSYLKSSLIRKIEVGQILTVKIAHLWQNGYWAQYTTHNYCVISISRKEIVGKNVDYKHEHIKINRKDLDTESFIILI